MKANGLEGTCSEDLLIVVLHSSTEIADVEKIIKVKQKFLAIFLGGKLGYTGPAPWKYRDLMAVNRI